MATEPITIEVEPEIAKAYEAVPPERQRKI